MDKAADKAAPTPEEIDAHIAALNAEAEAAATTPEASPPKKVRATPARKTAAKKVPTGRDGKPLAKAPSAPKAASKAAADPKAICRWGEGRYYSPKNEPACKLPKAPKKELCPRHEIAMREARKAAHANDAPKAPKVIRGKPKPSRPPKGTSDDALGSALAASVAALGGASGGAKRTVKPPVPAMHVAPVPRTPQPAMVMLVAEGES